MSLSDKSTALFGSNFFLQKCSGFSGFGFRGRFMEANFLTGETMKRFAQWIYLVAVCLALTNVGFPQASSSSLRGTVTDPSGSALPGATVVVTSTELQITRTSTTGAVGDYGFPALPPGTYNLTVTATGFARYRQTDIQLLVNTPATANVQLKVGAASENVTVTSEAPVLNLVDASIGNSFSQIQVQQIPLEGRNVPDLLSLKPAWPIQEIGRTSTGTRTPATEPSME